MNIKHTQEMWTEFERRRDVKLVDGYFVVPLREEDYKRARACVNACDGMTTEFLESFPNVCFAANTTEYASIMIERDTLKQQRDELLEALVEIRDSNGWIVTEHKYLKLLASEAIAKARAA